MNGEIKIKVVADAFVLKAPLVENYGEYKLTRNRVPTADGVHLWEVHKGDTSMNIGTEEEMRALIVSLSGGS